MLIALVLCWSLVAFSFSSWDAFLGPEEYGGEYDAFKAFFRCTVVFLFCITQMESRLFAISFVIAQVSATMMVFTGALSFGDWQLDLEGMGLDILYYKMGIEMVPFLLAVAFAYITQAKKEESYWEPQISDAKVKAMNLSSDQVVHGKDEDKTVFEDVDEDEVGEIEEDDDDDKSLISDPNPVNLIKAITKSQDQTVSSQKDRKVAKTTTPETKVRRSSRRSSNAGGFQNENNKEIQVKRDHAGEDDDRYNEDQENRHQQQKGPINEIKDKLVAVPDALSPKKKQSSTLINAREEAARLQRERTEQRIRELRQRRSRK